MPPEQTVKAPRASCAARKWPLLCPHLETMNKLFKATESESVTAEIQAGIPGRDLSTSVLCCLPNRSQQKWNRVHRSTKSLERAAVDRNADLENIRVDSESNTADKACACSPPLKRRPELSEAELDCFDLSSRLLNSLQMSYLPIINYTDLIKPISLTPQK